MSELRKAAQQALEYLAAWSVGESPNASAVNDLIAELEAVLAQPEPTNQCAETCERAKLCAVCARGLGGAKQEPVAWRWSTPRLRGLTWHYTNNRTFAESQPLYTQPPQRKPLTERELKVMWAEYAPNIGGIFEFARAIERAHGIGDNT